VFVPVDRQIRVGDAQGLLHDGYRRLGLQLMEGYAMTEDFGYSHASNLKHLRWIAPAGAVITAIHVLVLGTQLVGCR
jgi:hypothetical protein